MFRAVCTAISALLITLTAPAFAGQKGDVPSADVQLDAMIGQMIMVGFEGSRRDDPSFQALLKKAASGRISGALYLQRNLGSKRDVIAMNRLLTEAAENPFLIAIDQEGGEIQRIPRELGFPTIASARKVAGSLTPRQAFEAYSGLARHLSDWGFNYNFAPVADLDVNSTSPAIGRFGRSFSSNADVVVQYCAAFIDAHRQYGVLTSLKHFPGHGSAVTDSHDGFVDVTKTAKSEELQVFKDLIDQDFADSVMIGHIHNGKLQPDSDLPATLDRRVVIDLLRKKLGFHGVVVTDDLQMAALSRHFDLRDTVVKAVLAGNDLLVFGNSRSVDPRIDEKVAAILREEAASNPLVREAIVRAAGKVAALKTRLADRTGAIDGMSTRSIAPSPRLLTRDFVRAQQRDVQLVPVF